MSCFIKFIFYSLLDELQVMFLLDDGTLVRNLAGQLYACEARVSSFVPVATIIVQKELSSSSYVILKFHLHWPLTTIIEAPSLYPFSYS